MRTRIVFCLLSASVVALSACCAPYGSELYAGGTIADTTLAPGDTARYDLFPDVWYTRPDYGGWGYQYKGVPGITVSTSNASIVEAGLVSDTVLTITAHRSGRANIVVQAYIRSACGELVADATHFTITVTPTTSMPLAAQTQNHVQTAQSAR